MKRRLTWLLSLPALLGLPACDDEPVAPTPSTERYSLVEVGGATLPAVVFDEDIILEEGSFRLQVTVTEGWMDLDEEGGYRHQVKRIMSVDGHPTPSADWNDRGRYEATAAGLRFTSDVLAPVIFDAVQEAGEIRFQHDLSGEGRPIPTVYRR